MSSNELLEKAIQNNVDWCDAVARAHQLTTVRHQGFWLCEQQMPPFYPNVITTEKDGFNPSAFNDYLAALGVGWAIKDSLNESMQQAHTYQRLFQSVWYGYESHYGLEQQNEFERLSAVAGIEDLARWRKAFGANEAEDIFIPALLEMEGVTFVYLSDSDAITCGAVLMVSADVIGISNLFGEPEDQQRLVKTLQLTYPQKSIVGYGSEEELCLLKPFGFLELGELSVLLKID